MSDDDFNETAFNDYMKRNFPRFVPAEPEPPHPTSPPGAAHPDVHQGPRAPADDAGVAQAAQWIRAYFPTTRRS